MIFFKDNTDGKKSSGRQNGGYEISEDGSRSNSGGQKASGEAGKKPSLKIGIVLPRQIFQQRRYQVGKRSPKKKKKG